jgi:hypothetical protein
MRRNRRNHRACRGSICLHVLASSLLVTILGLGSLLAVRLQMRSARLSRDVAEARVCAASAIQVGLWCVKQDASWRTTRPNGVWLQDKPLGAGRFTLEGVDPTDSVLSDSQYEPIILTGTGTKGAARHKMQLTLVPVIKPLEALSTCLHGSTLITVSSGKLITLVGAPLSTNGQLANNGTIDGSAQANVITGAGTITGTSTPAAPAKPMPDTSVITNYASKATTIAYSGDIDKAVLAPGCNPWGSTDPNGLYVLNTGGSAITIKNTRIYGTLVINAPNKTVTLDGAMFCQNYNSQFPVLLVNGNLVIKCTSASTTLSESTNSKNYNPTGAPYEGVTDTDTSDTYPNEIRGLIHVNGSVTLQQTARIVGTILCHSTVSFEGTNTLVHDPSLVACPPNGYTYVDGMAISPRSWKQVVD